VVELLLIQEGIRQVEIHNQVDRLLLREIHLTQVEIAAQVLNQEVLLQNVLDHLVLLARKKEEEGNEKIYSNYCQFLTDWNSYGPE
jgi:hypothetical protein